jgi:hypothetical protein
MEFEQKIKMGHENVMPVLVVSAQICWLEGEVRVLVIVQGAIN